MPRVDAVPQTEKAFFVAAARIEIDRVRRRREGLLAQTEKLEVPLNIFHTRYPMGPPPGSPHSSISVHHKTVTLFFPSRTAFPCAPHAGHGPVQTLDLHL